MVDDQTRDEMQEATEAPGAAPAPSERVDQTPEEMPEEIRQAILKATGHTELQDGDLERYFTIANDGVAPEPEPLLASIDVQEMEQGLDQGEQLV